MTEILNGKDTAPLAGWVIALIQGRLMIGRPSDGRLEPVYDFAAGMGQTPKGLMYDCIVQPPLGLNSLRSLPLPTDAVKVRIEELTKEERRMISARVIQCDEMLRAVRVAASGIAIAKSMPGVKP